MSDMLTECYKQLAEYRDRQRQNSPEIQRQRKWDLRFLRLARHYALENSKDPSTKTGAVIVDKDHRVVSMGYNGFAKGVIDRPEWLNDRKIKYQVVLHCEENACLFAERSLKGCTLYTWPFGSCAHCAAIVIQKGIKRCVSPVLPPELAKRWDESLILAKQQFDDAGVELVFYTPEEIEHE